MKREWVRRFLAAWSGVAASALAYACDGETSPTAVVAEGGAPPNKKVATDASEGTLDSAPAPIEDGDCSPPSIETFEPTWKAPAPFAQGACSNAQVEALICQLDQNADQTACAALVKDKANEACQKCMFTPSSAAKLGPIVITGNLASLNVPGCIANSDGDTTDQSCGAKLQAAEQCADEACEVNMPCDYGGTVDPRTACVEIVCGPFAAAATCAESLLAPGGIAAACADPGAFLAHATALAKLFCAGGSTDASTDVTDAADAPDVSDAPNDG